MDIQKFNEELTKLGNIEYLDYNGENKGIDRFLIAMNKFDHNIQNLVTFYSLLGTYLPQYKIISFFSENDILRVELNIIN